MIRKPHISLEQVRTFIAVSKAANMSRAAEALFLTQGAVTQQIRHLERALDVQLIERTGRGVRLTLVGVEVAAACTAAARELEGIEETARLHRSLGTGSIHIGASPTSANHYLPPLLTKYKQRFPRVEIKVTTASTPSVAKQVANAEVDCGLIEGPTSYPNLEARELYEDAMVVVVSCAHPLAKSRHPGKEELRRHDYLAREPSSAAEALAREMLGQAYGVSPRMELSHLDAVRAAVIEGLGFAVLPEVVVARELKAGDLVRLGIPRKKRWITAIRRPTTRVPSVEAFWSILPGGSGAVKHSAAST